MNQESNNQPDPEMLAEYDFRNAWEVCRPFRKGATWSSSILMWRKCSQIPNLSIRRCVL